MVWNPESLASLTGPDQPHSCWQGFSCTCWVLCYCSCSYSRDLPVGKCHMSYDEIRNCSLQMNNRCLFLLFGESFLVVFQRAYIGKTSPRSNLYSFNSRWLFNLEKLVNAIKLNAFLIGIMKFQWNSLTQMNFFWKTHCLLLESSACLHWIPNSWVCWAFLVQGLSSE